MERLHIDMLSNHFCPRSQQKSIAKFVRRVSSEDSSFQASTLLAGALDTIDVDMLSLLIQKLLEISDYCYFKQLKVCYVNLQKRNEVSL
jgi:prenyltransferase beta subunit